MPQFGKWFVQLGAKFEQVTAMVGVTGSNSERRPDVIQSNFSWFFSVTSCLKYVIPLLSYSFLSIHHSLTLQRHIQWFITSTVIQRRKITESVMMMMMMMMMMIVTFRIKCGFIESRCPVDDAGPFT
jgi:hypothetical protein